MNRDSAPQPKLLSRDEAAERRQHHQAAMCPAGTVVFSQRSDFMRELTPSVIAILFSLQKTPL
jgi:hypothetical protein